MSKFSSDLLEHLKLTYEENELDAILQSLVLPPKFTTLRCNRVVETSCICSELSNIYPNFTVETHPKLKDAVIVTPQAMNSQLKQASHSVIVDTKVAKSVLRGADIYVPGVKGMSPCPSGTPVSIYADINNRCKRGEKRFLGEKVHIANGTIEIERHKIFKEFKKVGIAVCVTERKVNFPSFNNIFPDRIFLQNLPSILVGHVLDPQPNEVILDMCAAPGGKATHIAALMNNTGSVIALEKVSHKVKRLERNVNQQNATCIKCYQYDSTECFSPTATGSVHPPFGNSAFDRILVDPPCSGLGQRPQLVNTSKFSEIKSFPLYQWSFVSDAIKMLKVGGTLAYSTCTLARQENEDMVARIISTFPSMKLVAATPILGQPGLPTPGLRESDLLLVQRFDPDATSLSVNKDTIGFFIAKFFKATD